MRLTQIPKLTNQQLVVTTRKLMRAHAVSRLAGGGRDTEPLLTAAYNECKKRHINIEHPELQENTDEQT